MVRGEFEPVCGAEDSFGEDVVVVMHGDEAVLLPLSARNLSARQASVLRHLMLTAGAYEQALEDLESAVGEARDEGLSWDLVGFAIGRTGSAARRRFGSVEPFDGPREK